MGKISKNVVLALFLAGGLVLSSCSNTPSDEEMKQLNDLKAEVSSLEKQVAEKQREKAALEKQVAEKNGKLQQCQSDQEAVKKGLGK
jgi:septal ring factor EnvC (AmiA/AmiB activator)